MGVPIPIATLIAYEAPSNLKYFYAETEDGYDVEIYPKLNIADDDIRCLKHGEVDERLQDELWFFFGMFLDFKSLGPDGMRRFLENVAGKGHLDNNTLENLATLANQYFTDYPRGFGHVELFRCVERIASNADNSSQAIDEVSQKARDLFDEGDSSDNFNELNKWATKFRNNVAHGKQEPLPHDEADLTTYLKLILSCHLLSDYADKSIWKNKLSSLFWDIQHKAGTKQQD